MLEIVTQETFPWWYQILYVVRAMFYSVLQEINHLRETTHTAFREMDNKNKYMYKYVENLDNQINYMRKQVTDLREQIKHQEKELVNLHNSVVMSNATIHQISHQISHLTKEVTSQRKLVRPKREKNNPFPDKMGSLGPRGYTDDIDSIDPELWKEFKKLIRTTYEDLLCEGSVDVQSHRYVNNCDLFNRFKSENGKSAQIFLGLTKSVKSFNILKKDKIASIRFIYPGGDLMKESIMYVKIIID